MVAPSPLSKLMDGVRATERRLMLPTNALFGAAIGITLLVVFYGQATSLRPCNADLAVRKVTALQSSLEELEAAGHEDRQALLQLKEELKQAQSEKARLEVWKAEQAHRSQIQSEHLYGLAQDLAKLWPEIMGVSAPPTLDKLKEMSPPLEGILSEEEVGKRLGVSSADAIKGDKEIELFRISGPQEKQEAAVGALPLRLLGARVRIMELTNVMAQRVAKAKADAAEAAANGGSSETLAECKALAGAVAKAKGPKNLKVALQQCVDTAMTLALAVQAQKTAVARKVEHLEEVLQHAAVSTSALADTVKTELKDAQETCKVALANRNADVPAKPATPTPAELCGSLGCRCGASDAEIALYMNYTVREACPDDWLFVQSLLVEKNCHSLPRRRCFARNWPDFAEPLLLPGALWDPAVLNNSNVRWGQHFCKSYECLQGEAGSPADCPGCFDFKAEKERLESKEKNQMSIKEILTASNSSLRIGLDIGGGTGTFAAIMAEKQVTILTTGIDLDGRPAIGGGGEELTRNGSGRGVPYMETVAARGLVPLHLALNQRLPFFDATLDIIHASSSVDEMPYAGFEELFFEFDRVLRPGGLIWFSLFHSQVRMMPQYMEIVELFKYNFLRRTVTPSVRPDGLHVYMNFLIEKPRVRDIKEPPPTNLE